MNNFEKISEKYQVFLVDLYGVIQFGSGINPEALAVLASLKEQGKKVVIMSNATYLSATAEERYAAKGLIKGKHYDAFITAGQFASEEIRKNSLPVKGEKFCVLGTANFKSNNPVPSVLNGTKYRLSSIFEADFVYCGVPQVMGIDRRDIEDFIPYLSMCVKYKLPMFSCNADKIANEGGMLVIRQGTICDLYEALGGKVIMYAKPDPRVYQRAIGELGGHYEPKDILMIGDSLYSDILGANRFGCDSCLTVKGGVTNYMMLQKGLEVNEENIKKYIQDEKSGIPDYIVSSIF